MPKTRFELYKSLHERELDRRTDLNSSVSIPIGIISGILAVLFFFVSNFSADAHGLLKWAFIIFAVLSFAALILSIGFLFKFYTNAWNKSFEYKGLGYAKKLDQDYKNLEKHFLQVSNSDATSADKNFIQYLTDDYIEMGDWNARMNDTKAHFLYIARGSLIYAVIFLFLCSIPFGINNFSKEKKTTFSVKIENFEENNEKLKTFSFSLDSIKKEYLKLQELYVEQENNRYRQDSARESRTTPTSRPETGVAKKSGQTPKAEGRTTPRNSND